MRTRGTPGGPLVTRRLWLPLAIGLAFAGCQQPLAPPDAQQAPGVVTSLSPSSMDTHVLRQAPTALGLETYQVSFWVHKGEASTVKVSYRSVAPEEEGQAFLRLDIPRHG